MPVQRESAETARRRSFAAPSPKTDFPPTPKSSADVASLSFPEKLNETSVPSQNLANPAAAEHPVVFFDGVCGFCNYTVNWLMARDPERRLRFAPLQGTTAEQQLDRDVRTRLDTLVFISAGRTFTRTAAVSRMLMTLGGRWKLLGGLLWIIPWPIRDLGYRIISKLRYRLFGKYESCRLPTPAERAVFLD